MSIVEEQRARYEYSFLDGFLGAGYASLGRYGEALSLLEGIYNEAESFGGDYAACLWSLGQRERAIYVLHECAERHPQETEYLVQLVSYLVSEKRPLEAYDYLIKLIMIAPHHEERASLEERVDEQLERH